ncbi:hypothetical protein [Algiphilus sp.]|uniref:hypothetical protein n=1 Tax=Algiphilus sp. TaxID=1872431 RepID=UPI003CCC1526
MPETPAYMQIEFPLYATVGQEINLAAALESTVRAFGHLCSEDEVRRATQWLADRHREAARDE